ncbi:phage antirepressor [Clostridium botulinum]|uniref:phage antirepressor n=1 Tax=Clostridium botulinum TaxID=1491 RepID=UPI0004D4204A|nr:phage antirepressor KilAC domain-containing protein [Clostridium botulinum]KEH99695.1 prophage antirepressor [Clostridium botulinum C/D str. BKT75002]KEI05173.1 putative type I site-specific deoxyribonuclease, M subunit [Clostridium botulinum C/D str. BKT2873]QPW62069.1 phage antirepressor KilAC domain-containing protein [Clostridium botulinum]
MSKEIKRVGITEILGKEIEFYSSWEEPYFVANEVAIWLGERDGSTVARKVDDDEKLIHTICVTGQNRETTMLTEDGLYEALMKSRKEIAKPLKKKIKQYLKQIRKTGGAVEDGREEEFIYKYFPSFSDDVKMSMVQDLLKSNKELKPKADYHDKVLNPTDENFRKLLTTSEIAKDLNMSARKLNSTLKELHIIYKQGKTWMPYAEYQNMIPEYFDYHVNEYGQVLKYTEKGRKWIIQLLKEKEIA